MAVKDFVNNSGLEAVVCNYNGKVWRLKQAPPKVQKQLVLGTSIHNTDKGQVLFVWVD